MPSSNSTNSRPFETFFDVPVYRIPEGQYYQEREDYIERTLLAAGGAELHPDVVRQVREHCQVRFGGPWQFNEIVGYIRLHFVGSQIRGEYFAPNGVRVAKTRHKTFWRQTHKLAPEVDIPRDATSKDIFELLTQYIESCRRERPRRWIDDTLLMKLGPHVDWRAIYDAA